MAFFEHTRTHERRRATLGKQALHAIFEAIKHICPVSFLQKKKTTRSQELPYSCFWYSTQHTEIWHDKPLFCYKNVKHSHVHFMGMLFSYALYGTSLVSGSISFILKFLQRFLSVHVPIFVFFSLRLTATPPTSKEF